MILPWPYLSVDEVLELHAREVGPDLLRDRALLESAVARPAMSVGQEDLYPTVHDKAAALLHSLTRNHAFIDGNKRAALISTYVFYRRNGYQFVADPDDVANLIIAVAEGSYEVGALAGSLKSHVEPIPDDTDDA